MGRWQAPCCQPARQGADVAGVELAGNLAHAVWLGGMALAGLPATQLCTDVVGGQAQQARHGRQAACELQAMAQGAGWQALGRIALGGQLVAALQFAAAGAWFGRHRERHGLCREILRDVLQVAVIQCFEQTCHEGVVTPPNAEVDQLVVQVGGGFARQARVVAIGPGTPLLAVAGGAGPRALRHAVFEISGLRTLVQPQTHQQREDAKPKMHAAELTASLGRPKPGWRTVENTTRQAPGTML